VRARITNPDGLVAASVLQHLKHGDVDVLLGIVFGDFARGRVAETWFGAISDALSTVDLETFHNIPGMSGATTRKPMAEKASI
jgi:hypothetical protein